MTSDTDSIIRYDILVENALRSVIKEALLDVQKNGLHGDHHFYITFNTLHPKVILPDYLKMEYNPDMTIVLQYEFYDLKIYEDRFNVTLSFDDILEKLEIPYAAITTFADPSVNFALQFSPVSQFDEDEDLENFELKQLAQEVLEGKAHPTQALSETNAQDQNTDLKKKNTSSASAQESAENNNVVTLDAFRNKKK